MNSWKAFVFGCGMFMLPLVGRAADTQTTLSPQAAEALKLVDSDDLYQQELGFLRLEALREPASSASIRHYINDRRVEKRAWALRALAAIEGQTAIPVLVDKVRRDRQPRVRQAALLGLEPLQALDPEIMSVCLKALRDHSSTVRMTAVDIVSRIDDPRARAAILTRRQRERDKDVQRVLRLAIARIETS